MDTGSTKEQLVAQIEKILPDDIYFVGAHPIAGSHKASVAEAVPNLFEGSIYCSRLGKLKRVYRRFRIPVSANVMDNLLT